MGTFKIVNAATAGENGGRVGIGPGPSYVPPSGWGGETTPGDIGSDDAHLIGGFFSGTLVYHDFGADPSGANVRLGFDQNTAIFELDGNPAVSFNSLPAGFLITALTVGCQATANFGAGISASFDSNFLDDTGGGNFSLSIISPGNSMSPLHFIGQTLNTDFQKDAAVNLGGSSISYNPTFGSPCLAFGTYAVFTQSYILHTPTNPVNTASPVTVTSDPNDPNAMNFEDILTVDITYIDSNGDPQTINVPQINWITVDVNEFIFSLPTIPADATVITIVVTSSQFSGSVPLGSLITIYFTSASGIYKLVLNKRNDTLYIEADLPNTIDVKIPDPFAKGNFIGS